MLGHDEIRININDLLHLRRTTYFLVVKQARRASAATLTGLGVKVCLRPCGRSGCVTTAFTSNHYFQEALLISVLQNLECPLILNMSFYTSQTAVLGCFIFYSHDNTKCRAISTVISI